MSITSKINGAVKGGRFIPEYEMLFKRAFWILEGQRVTVTVKKFQKKRSNEQNAYLWGVVYLLISEATGYTLEETHDACRGLYLCVQRGNLPLTLKSTAKLSTKEFEKYTENIRRGASVGTFGASLYIPLPNECEY